MYLFLSSGCDAESLGTNDELDEDKWQDLNVDEQQVLDEDIDAEEDMLEEEDNFSSSSSSTDSDISDELPVTCNILDLMNKCRTIVNTVRKSSIIHEKVVQLALSSSMKVGLIIDMKIRWNSTYKMIDRLLLFQGVLKSFYDQLQLIDGITRKQYDKLVEVMLSDGDWFVLSAMKRILERFEAATRILSGHKYPTLSMAYAVIYSLSFYLQSKSKDSVEEQIKNMLSESFNKFLDPNGHESKLSRVAALLDPMTYDVLRPDDKACAQLFIVKEVRDYISLINKNGFGYINKS